MLTNQAPGSERLMILCSTCGDAIPGGQSCCTCGEQDPREPPPGAKTELDEDALLHQVGLALAAELERARHVARAHTSDAVSLTAQTLVLRRRLRAEVALMRRLVDAQQRSDTSKAAFSGAIGRVETALAAAEGTDSSWSVDAVFAPDLDCARIARLLVGEYVREHLAEPAAGDALLVVSELVSNAMEHGTGTITFRAERLADRLRIEVIDEGRPDHIEPTPANPRKTHGHGLWLVDTVCAAWGTEDGTSEVWAEVAVP